MNKITTFLTYNNQAEEAVNLYVSIFKNSKVVNMNRMGPDGPVLSATFELDGQEFMALNGGPSFSFAEGISLYVDCKTQEEVDYFWDKLTAGGGEPGRCGWLKDKFGVSWQVIPRALNELMGDPDPAKAKRVVQAMLGMNKIEIAGLRRAYDGS